MDMTIFLSVLFLLLSLCAYSGKLATKNLSTQSDYFLAGRDLGFFPLFMTLVATQVGGGLVLGSAEEAYKYGWSVLLYPLGASLGFLLLAAGIGKKMAQFKVSTVAQLFEVVYGSPFLKKVASILSIVSLFMIFVAQVIASKKFMLSLGVESEALFLGMWLLAVVYAVIGGLKGVVAIDIVQALYFIVIFFLSACVAYFWGGFSPGEATFSTVTFEGSSAKWFGWLLMPLFFMVIEQDMGQRCFAAKSTRVVTKAAFWSGVCVMAVCTIPVMFGMFARQQGIVVAPGASILMRAVEVMTNPYIASFMGCAILAAIISTADSLINAISSNLVQDFDAAWMKKEKNLKVTQGITAVIALAGVFGSYYFNNIVDVLIQSYELSVSGLFVPVFIGLYARQGNSISALLSVASGMGCYFICQVYPAPIPRELLSIFISLIGFGLGELYIRTRAPKIEESLENS